VLDSDFEILGLKLGASLEQVKQAHRDLVTVWHPDRHTTNLRLQEKAEAKLKEINAAYDRLRVLLGTSTDDGSQTQAPPPPPHSPSSHPTSETKPSASRRSGSGLIMAGAIITLAALCIVLVRVFDVPDYGVLVVAGIGVCVLGFLRRLTR
jgi:hypothetical protein